MGGFMLRIDDDVLKKFDEIREEQSPNQSRESLVREMVERYIERYIEQKPEEYYTIKGYSTDHKKYADIRNMDGFVSEHMIGFRDEDENELLILEHAKDLIERSNSGDKEEAIALFKSIFGERNVFLKED